MGAEFVQFKVETFPSMRVIGKSETLIADGISLEDPSINGLWDSMEEDSSFAVLERLPGHVGPQGDRVGWMGDFAPPGVHFTYLAGALFSADVEAPVGFIYRDIAAGEMGVSQIQGTADPAGDDLHADASAINIQAMAGHDYEYDGSRGMFEMEYRSYARYYIPLERGEQPMLDFYSPCKKKDEAGNRPSPGIDAGKVTLLPDFDEPLSEFDE